jgi:hypothetical protein
VESDDVGILDFLQDISFGWNRYDQQSIRTYLGFSPTSFS